ncbi:hypothetical protein [Ammoniphilus oxalaticus]|uniref:hypothetical protein n=1 Tax=Ammoniphilus oxalaticus TaxID=66863 RepID=UPI0014741946|nr:hypothetical protein [Ammoniphilus oxalaticus]
MREREQNYDATYHVGNTRVYVVAPTVTNEEKSRVLANFHQAGWNILEKLHREEARE